MRTPRAARLCSALRRARCISRVSAAGGGRTQPPLHSSRSPAQGWGKSAPHFSFPRCAKRRRCLRKAAGRVEAAPCPSMRRPMQPENHGGAQKKSSMLRKLKKASSKLWKSATGQTDDRGRFVAEPPPPPPPRAPPPAAAPPPPPVATAAAPTADEKARRTAARLEKKRRRAAARNRQKARDAAVPGAPPAPTRQAPRPPPPTRDVPSRPPPPPPRAAPTAPNPCDLGIPGAAAKAKADGDSQFRANNVVAARESYTRALDRLGVTDDVADATRRSFRAALLSNRAACDMALARQHGASKGRVCYHRAIRDCTAAFEAAPAPYARAMLRRGQAKLAVGNSAGAILCGNQISRPTPSTRRCPRNWLISTQVRSRTRFLSRRPSWR